MFIREVSFYLFMNMYSTVNIKFGLFYLSHIVFLLYISESNSFERLFFFQVNIIILGMLQNAFNEIHIVSEIDFIYLINLSSSLNNFRYSKYY